MTVEKMEELKAFAVEIGFDIDGYKDKYQDEIKKSLKYFTKKKMLISFLVFPILSFIVLVLSMFLISIKYSSWQSFVLIFSMSFTLSLASGVLLGVASLLLNIERGIVRVMKLGHEIIKSIIIETLDKVENLNMKDIYELIIFELLIPETTRIVKRGFSYTGLKIYGVINRNIKKMSVEVIKAFEEKISLNILQKYLDKKTDSLVKDVGDVIAGEINVLFWGIGRLVSGIIREKLFNGAIKLENILDFKFLNQKILKIKEEKDELDRITTIYKKIDSATISKLRKIKQIVTIIGVVLLSIEVIQMTLLLAILNNR